MCIVRLAARARARTGPAEAPRESRSSASVRIHIPSPVTAAGKRMVASGARWRVVWGLLCSEAVAATPLTGTIACTPASCLQLADAARKAGALLASPSPTGTFVSVVLPAFIDRERGLLAEVDGVEPMWEPDDWQSAAVTFETEHVASTLTVRPLRGSTDLSGGTGSGDEDAQPAVRLLEHPHAFLTTAAGKLHASTINVRLPARQCALQRALLYAAPSARCACAIPATGRCLSCW